MADDRLATYRGMRDPKRTPEPGFTEGPLPAGNDDTFVIQEHHARRLHWDFRLERDGVLVSWALPKGVPDDPARNHLAVHTEDHPIEYASFAGEIPRGEYGGGQVVIWDRGTYETEKWTDREVKVVLHGTRVSGRYVLFPTDGRNWMIHRMDPPVDPDAVPPPPLTGPARLRPVIAAERGRLPRNDDDFGYEFAWGGRRALMLADHGGVEAVDEDGEHVGVAGLGGLGGAHRALFDGELVELAGTTSYLISDLLYLDGHRLMDLPYRERRERLDELDPSGPRWQVAPWFAGGGAAVADTARERGLPGVVAKRLGAPYDPGKADWRFVRGTGKR